MPGTSFCTCDVKCRLIAKVTMLSSHLQISQFRIDVRGFLGFAFFALLGVLFASYPLPALGLATGTVVFWACWVLLRRWLEFWQLTLLIPMTAYVVLNYGFDNLAVPLGGLGIPVGEIMMMAALGMAMLKGRMRGMGRLCRETPIACLLALIIFTGLHLAADIPRYGAYAVRDSSIFLDAFLLFLGLFWARQPRSSAVMTRWLMFLFVINLVYCYSFPLAEELQAISPSSGVFHPVPLLGNYQHNAVYLISGVAFCLWIAPAALRIPVWICWSLALAQLCGLALLQARSMYVAILVLLVVLFLLGESKKTRQLAFALPLGFATLALLVGVMAMLGVQLRGRVGPVGFAFLEQHAGSLLSLAEERGGMGQDADRGEWYSQVWERTTASPVNLIVGEGFGQPLIDFKNEQGIAVRQPHNSSLSVFARLGTVGLSLWLTFLFAVARQLVAAIRRHFTTDDLTFQLTLLLFLYFLVALIQTSVQPALEFSHGAFPFYFLTGFGLGLVRWQKCPVPAASLIDGQRNAWAY
jgi:hypothetical protein